MNHEVTNTYENKDIKIINTINTELCIVPILTDCATSRAKSKRMDVDVTIHLSTAVSLVKMEDLLDFQRFKYLLQCSPLGVTRHVLTYLLGPEYVMSPVYKYE